ncbi:MAG: major capsid protein [Microvirus sp.]|nr:MAG: major capsid protein [Microvirus sp.]
MAGTGGRSPGHGDYTFSAVPRADIPRSVFTRNHGYKTTMNANALVPFYVDEALPGDTFNLKVHVFARLATPIVPIMDNLYCDVFFFAVPNRILWTHWVNMMGEQPLGPADSISYTVPQITLNIAQITTGSIYDYMGIPVGNITQPTISINALPLRAYALIWDRWFRDENMQNAINPATGDGPDLGTAYTLKSRGKRHDYFTSCLPWPQKFTAPTLTLTGNLPVRTQVAATVTGAQAALGLSTSATGAALPASPQLGGSAAGSTAVYGGSGFVTTGGWYPNNLYADPSTVGFTINAMRQSFQIQKMLERDARGGTRYPEKILAHFGVTNPDMRMQYPEFLGGGTIPIQVNPVAQTADVQRVSPGGAPVTGATMKGDLAGFAVANGPGNGFTKSFTEHMTLIGLMQIRADLTYQQGIHRMWDRLTQYDYYWPALSHLGEQAVLQSEIYATGVPAQDNVIFGYQERWAEYRYYPSLITGLFRSRAGSTIDVWHLSQNFSVAPVLGDTFIQDNPPVSRVVAVPSQPQFLVDTYFDMKCARPMPMYSVPGLIDHF